MPLAEDGSKAYRHHWEKNPFPNNGPAVTFYWIYPVFGASGCVLAQLPFDYMLGLYL